MTTLPPVARNINVFCKKCDSERYFKVITHLDETTAKLKCEVCGTHRNYSIDEATPSTAVKRASGAKSTAKAAKAPKNKTASAWLTLKEQYKGPEAVEYNMAHKFTADASLVHPTFGLGFVTKALPNKIEVLFSEGVKELLHSRK